MKENKKVSVIGASGFTGCELVRILSKHDGVIINDLLSRSYSGKKISDIHNSLKGICDIELKSMDINNISDTTELVFLAMPHTKSFDFVPGLIEKGLKIVDLSADYRFSDPAEYTKCYETEHKDSANLQEAVYSIPEINRQDILDKKIIANPGCYATSILLALYPLCKEGIISGKVYIDSKSGISGAGKKLDEKYLYYSRYENISPYNVNKHRHMGEIRDFLGSKEISIDFVFCPHLIPLERGILSNIYCTLNSDKGLEEKDIIGIYHEYYSGEKFININQPGIFPSTKDVLNTNNCNMSVCFNPESGDLVVMSVIDNLIKGASGQAVQNMNIVLGFDESAGLA